MRLIDADDFGNRMYHEAFEKDSDLQKWDSGCWIRYKLFENVLREQPTIQPETATVTIGRTRGGVAMWYECDACGEPIDQKDCYCRNCGRKLTLPEPYLGGEQDDR